MQTTVTAVDQIPPLTHEEAMGLARTEYENLTAIVDQLRPQDWASPTGCTGWDVTAVLAHVLGMLEGNADPAEAGRQAEAAGRRAATSGEAWIDALTALQVTEHAQLTRGQLAEAVRGTAPRSLAARAQSSPEQRAEVFHPGPPFDEEWTYGYLIDVIHTRDPWMHRIDICRAIGAEPVLSAEHDGRIVAGVVAEWVRRHGRPCTLVLTGPAGGSYSHGTAGPHLELDAVRFCRMLSGRGSGDGLLAQQVPF